jgi:hypothetical protein
MTNLRIVAATVLISASLVCAAFALSKGQQAAKGKCDAKLQYCYDITCGHGGYGAADLNRCQAFCDSAYLSCMHNAGVPGYLSHPTFTPTPRPGGSGVSGLPESNPTATPRTGPGGVSGLPKSHPSPTPSPSGPTLLNKHAKSTPTPTPNHYHGNPTPTPTPNHYHGHSPTPTPNPNRSKGHQ